MHGDSKIIYLSETLHEESLRGKEHIAEFTVHGDSKMYELSETLHEESLSGKETIKMYELSETLHEESLRGKEILPSLLYMGLIVHCIADSLAVYFVSCDVQMYLFMGYCVQD